MCTGKFYCSDSSNKIIGNEGQSTLDFSTKPNLRLFKDDWLEGEWWERKHNPNALQHLLHLGTVTNFYSKLLELVPKWEELEVEEIRSAQVQEQNEAVCDTALEKKRKLQRPWQEKEEEWVGGSCMLTHDFGKPWT